MDPRRQLSVATPRAYQTHRARVVVDEHGCWIYRQPASSRARPRITVNGVTVEAYWFFWLCHTKTPVPDGMMLLHSCDRGEEGCVNPAHLRIGTPSENNKDAVERDRHANRNTRKTECQRGHPLEGDNLYVTPSGRRQCRTCRREADRARGR